MLARIRRSMDEKDQGFTLIELLVVMIIIGILAAIAIPVFLNQRQRAVESGMKSDLRTIANEIETAFVDNQAYPASAAVTKAAAPSTVVTVGAGGATVNVNSNAGITYTLDADGRAYCLAVTNTGATGVTYRYDSNAGGLLARNAACS